MNSTLKKGCIICGADLKGNKKAGFYCKKSNILFSYKSLKASGIIKRELVGSKKSDKFHKSECIGVISLKKENMVFFSSDKTAKKRGYSHCALCYPNYPR
ncbi:MAG: hypothetical protein MAG795_00535 [Candidatus Woesearchaeota archaeon]|nr:hypothetical protein [Candidatus Woesearchaeota archaeon]